MYGFILVTYFNLCFTAEYNHFNQTGPFLMLRKTRITLLLIVIPIVITGCNLPMNQSKLGEMTNTNLDHWVTLPESKQKIQQDQTGYLVLDEAFVSIAARIHLIREAKQSLDLQYYIWGDDFIGNLMLSELLQAADRGVHVRILIDDQNGRQLDTQFKALMQHPNIEIKLYNPYKFRTLRIFDYVFRTKQINRRMHNKLIIADGAIAVTGGRNISSEYFDASKSLQFSDLDVLFFGQIIQQANQVFIDFWNHQLSFPVEQFVTVGQPDDLKQLRTDFIQFKRDNLQTGKKVDLEQQKLYKRLKYSQINWGTAYFLADSPDKTLAQAQGKQLIFNQIAEKMGEPKYALDLISAYFVPTQSGTEYISALPEKDVKVRVLTNSFVANDVALVHAFYQQYRKELLKKGVKLYEFKPYIQRERRTWYEIATGNVIPPKGTNRSSLHAKFINVDQNIFIGSFNFDPRSFNLNTEVGLMIESQQLHQTISDALDQYLPQIAYELQLDKYGEIIWLDQQADGTVIQYQTDPQTTKFQRFIMYSASYLPIEWMM